MALDKTRRSNSEGFRNLAISEILSSFQEGHRFGVSTDSTAANLPQIQLDLDCEIDIFASNIISESLQKMASELG